MKALIIIGAGPAGLTAALYAERYGLNTLILSEDIGGTANKAISITNYPGIKEISGPNLIKKFNTQIKTQIKKEKVISIEKNFLIKTNKSEYKSKTVIMATGTKRKKLQAKNADKFENKGISYCAICDAPLFKNKIVAVLGGANSAVEAALLLKEHAKKVYIIYRKNKLRADQKLIKKIKNKVEIIYNANIIEVKGNKFLTSIILDNNKEIKIDGLFVEFGGIPLTKMIKNIKLDKNGFIIVDEKKQTNIPGIFAAGDVTNNKLKQIITASSDGAIAANSAYEYCKNL